MPKIERMYAFVAEDKGPNDEGIIGIHAISREEAPMWLPLVGADMARVDSLRPIAREIARTTGKKVKLIQFTNREELEVITPEEP